MWLAACVPGAKVNLASTPEQIFNNAVGTIDDGNGNIVEVVFNLTEATIFINITEVATVPI